MWRKKRAGDGFKRRTTSAPTQTLRAHEQLTRNKQQHNARTRSLNVSLGNVLLVAPESARKIAAKNRSPMPTGIGGSFQLANSASPLGVIDSASAPTARMSRKAQNKIDYKVLRREKRAQNQRSKTKRAERTTTFHKRRTRA